ncbi:MAG TPA: multidrug effflux MFS transporter [Anaerolineae bacterium]|nr:multidrug effflux MFS transporter [Anaerolineae bacterium]
MALMMSLVAMSIDAMLPALADIGADLGVQQENTNQLIVTMIFLGLAAGQLVYGPLSDSIGRKPAIYLGYGVFFAGSLLSIFAVSFPMMLAGRLLQGIGMAAPRSVTMALIRDQYEGRAMAQVMSFISVVFILVPIIAPSFGQAILLVADWRAIFVALLLLGTVSLLWFALRQPETLSVARRAPLSASRIGRALREVLSNRVALGYTLMAGLIAGAFQGYLSSAQQVFQFQYELGTLFPVIFAINAAAIGLASFVNGRLVMRLGMRALARTALLTLCALSVAFVGVVWITSGQPALWLFMGYLMLAFFCVGIMFGNMNALAMEPLGHIAGVGAAVVGSLSTFLAIPLGVVIGQAYNGTVTPLVVGFAVLGLGALALMRWAEGARRPSPQDPQPAA